MAVLGAVLEAAARFVFLFDAPFNPDRLDHAAAWRRAWVRRHDAQTRIFYRFDAFDPVRGWAVKPGLANVEVFDHDRLSTNSKGIRGPEYSYDKAPGKKRILILGDSFTFGDEVSDAQTYPHYLQTLLPDSEFINLGVHGYGHDQMLLYLEEEGLRYHPDLVILGFIDADMARNLLDFRDYAKPRFELANGRLRLVNEPVPSPESELRREPFRSKFLDLLGLLRHAVALRPSKRREDAERITEAILDRLEDDVKRSGARLLLVHLPDRAGPPLPESAFFDRYCRARGLSCLDQLHAGSRLVFQRGGHWDAVGHRMIAEGIRDHLLRQR